MWHTSCRLFFPFFFLIKKFNVSRQFLTYSDPSKTRHHLLCTHLISAVTNWSALRPLTPYTTHQEFLTRPLEGSDQRPRGQLVIILQLDIIRGDALKDSQHISRFKQPSQDDIWKMSNLGFGRILSLIYLSRRLRYLWKVSLFFSLCPLNMKWGCWEFLSCPQLVPGYH